MLAQKAFFWLSLHPGSLSFYLPFFVCFRIPSGCPIAFTYHVFLGCSGLSWVLRLSLLWIALAIWVLAGHFEGNISQFAFVFLVIRLWLWVLGKSLEIIESAQSCSSVLHLVIEENTISFWLRILKSTFITWPRWCLLGFSAVSYSSFPLS